MSKILLKRGLEANLPTLSESELAYTTDKKDVYVGTAADGNVKLAKADAVDAAKTEAVTEAKTYADTKVANLVGSAPETLDTIEELANAFSKFGDTEAGSITEVLAGKADATHTHQATDIIESDDKQFVTAAQKTEWSAKETVEGSQAKVDAAKTEIKVTTDALQATVNELQTAAAAEIIDGGTF